MIALALSGDTATLAEAQTEFGSSTKWSALHEYALGGWGTLWHALACTKASTLTHFIANCVLATTDSSMFARFFFTSKNKVSDVFSRLQSFHYSFCTGLRVQDGRTALELAASRNATEIVTVMFQRAKMDYAMLPAAFSRACKQGNLEFASLLLQQMDAPAHATTRAQASTCRTWLNTAHVIYMLTLFFQMLSSALTDCNAPRNRRQNVLDWLAIKSSMPPAPDPAPDPMTPAEAAAPSVSVTEF